jgi:hypothetical protein
MVTREMIDNAYYLCFVTPRRDEIEEAWLAAHWLNRVDACSMTKNSVYHILTKNKEVKRAIYIMMYSGVISS